MQFAWGYVPTLVLEAAIRNRVFDVLDSGTNPMTVPEIASATGASVRGLTAIMNALVGLNFLAKDANEAYSLTPESSAFLVSTKPSFQGGIIRHASSQLIPKWLGINEVVATGKPAHSVNQQGDGSEFFKEFVVDIFPMSYPSAQALAKSLNLNGQPTQRPRSRRRLRRLGHRSRTKLPASQRHRRRLARRHPHHPKNRSPLQPRRPLLLRPRRPPLSRLRYQPQRRHPRTHPPQRRRRPQPQAPRQSLRVPRPRRHHRHRRVPRQRRPHRPCRQPLFRRQHARQHRRRWHLLLRRDQRMAHRSRLHQPPHHPRTRSITPDPRHKTVTASEKDQEQPLRLNEQAPQSKSLRCGACRFYTIPR